MPFRFAFHLTVYGGVVTSAPSAAPSSRNCTPATPTLSDAFAVMMTLLPVTTAPSAGEMIATAGGVASFPTSTETPAEVAVFPAASRARADRTCRPLVVVVVSHETLYGEVVSSAPSGLLSSRNCTPTTGLVSEAVTVTVPFTPAPAAGDVIVGTAGPTGPLFETTRFTAAPGNSNVPATGSELITEPAGIVVLGAVVIVPTTRPAPVMRLLAVACGKLTTFGTVVRTAPGAATDPSANCNTSMFKSVSVPLLTATLALTGLACATVTDPFGFSVTSYSARRPENTAVSTAGAPTRIVRWIRMCPGLRRCGSANTSSMRSRGSQTAFTVPSFRVAIS